jgi:hypothetical protein
VHLLLSTSLNIHFCYPVTSYETWGASYLWGKAWCAVTDNDRLFSGDDITIYSYFYYFIRIIIIISTTTAAIIVIRTTIITTFTH